MPPFFFFLLSSGLLLLLNILRASSVKDSLTLAGFHFLTAKRNLCQSQPTDECHHQHAEVQSLLIPPLPQLTLGEEFVWSPISMISTRPSSLQSLVPQRQHIPISLPEAHLMQQDGFLLSELPGKHPWALQSSIVLLSTPGTAASRSQRREQSQRGCVSRGSVAGGSLCSAKNRTVRTLLSMPYSLCHRERRCPDAFVLYILYIFIYIR